MLIFFGGNKDKIIQRNFIFYNETIIFIILIQVKQKGSGVSWVIEGDIKRFFDNIDHEIMLNILKKKIKDGRIIEIVRRFLKAGYLEFKKVHNGITGKPQGGIISPILANISK